MGKAKGKSGASVEELLRALLELNAWQASLIRDGLRSMAKSHPDRSVCATKPTKAARRRPST